MYDVRKKQCDTEGILIDDHTCHISSSFYNPRLLMKLRFFQCKKLALHCRLYTLKFHRCHHWIERRRLPFSHTQNQFFTMHVSIHDCILYLTKRVYFALVNSRFSSISALPGCSARSVQCAHSFSR